MLQWDVMILFLRQISSQSGEQGQIELVDTVDRKMMAEQMLRQSFAVTHFRISEVVAEVMERHNISADEVVALPAEAGQSLLNISISLTLLTIDVSSTS